MTGRAVSTGGRLRRPTLGEWVALIVAEGLVWLVAVVVDGYADWPPLPWVIAAAMLLVLVGWLLRLRSSDDSRWRGGAARGAPSTGTSDDRMGGTGSS